eukprot:CAMPEP_0167828468 /NCGR_PEP_ID=MMETSP0112_2-20121227/11437_1 /TAXON_ID=91324 /ORGANISM="Lotharella globosa, Strain CCCM811" /LENGTH=58 /DNA_ID=CAMNT_0007731687 /DNA_START=27 /DNA_END=203 /DNA_ORIENTATION=-
MARAASTDENTKATITGDNGVSVDIERVSRDMDTAFSRMRAGVVAVTANASTGAESNG